MTENKLEKHLRDYYESEHLPPSVLERLKQRITEEQTVTPSRRRVLVRWLAIAATALIAVLVGLLVWRPWYPQQQIVGRIAEEAARHHNLRLAVEVKADDYTQLRARMNNLEFSPVEPDSLKQMRMRLLGARYSSLQGHPAVEMKLADQRGEICTLIQARSVDQLSRVQGRSQHYVAGLFVDVWREKGLVMVLTRPIA